MSHASAKLAPMPRAGPFSAAMTGLGIVRSRMNIAPYSSRRIRPSSSGVRASMPWSISPMSPPAENARPLPVNTRTRTASSRSACLIASASCCGITEPMAFSFSGRLRRIQATPPSISSFTCCSTSTAISLPSFEHALSLFQERVHAFLLVVGREQEIEALALGGQPLGERALERLQNRFLRHAHGERRLGRDLPRHPLGDLDRPLIGDDLVHDAQLVRALRGQRG